MRRGEFWDAGLILLSSASAMCMLLLIISGLATYEWMWSIISSLQAELNGIYTNPQHSCWLCGMSRAFRAIWNGKTEYAIMLNPYSLHLFRAMIAGCVIGPALWGVLAVKSLRDE